MSSYEQSCVYVCKNHDDARALLRVTGPVPEPVTGAMIGSAFARRRRGAGRGGLSRSAAAEARRMMSATRSLHQDGWVGGGLG